MIKALYVKYIGPQPIIQKQKNRNQIIKPQQKQQIKPQIRQQISVKKRTTQLQNHNINNNQVYSNQSIQKNINRQHNNINHSNPQQPPYSIFNQQQSVQPRQQINYPTNPQLRQTRELQREKRQYLKRGPNQTPRFLDQQRVAKLFIRKGYGVPVARKYLGPNVSNNQYTNLITTIVREAWRKIQEYVGQMRKIKMMNTNEFKVIKTQLVNCLKWMDQIDLNTFYGFLKIVYHIDNFNETMMNQSHAIRFYNALIRKYQDLRNGYQQKIQKKVRKEPGQTYGNMNFNRNINGNMNGNGNKYYKNPRAAGGPLYGLDVESDKNFRHSQMEFDPNIRLSRNKNINNNQDNINNSNNNIHNNQDNNYLHNNNLRQSQQQQNFQSNGRKKIIPSQSQLNDLTSIIKNKVNVTNNSYLNMNLRTSQTSQTSQKSQGSQISQGQVFQAGNYYNNNKMVGNNPYNSTYQYQYQNGNNSFKGNNNMYINNINSMTYQNGI